MKVMIILVALVLTLHFILFHTPLILMFLTVNGLSMYPTLKDGDKLWSVRTRFCKVHEGDIVVAKPYECQNRLVIKRVYRIDGDNYYLLGDNPSESYDSRNYGWVSQKEIVAKVMQSKS